MLPSCTSEERIILAGLEAEGLAGTKTDAQILSALVEMMVHQLERSRAAATMDPATAALSTLAQSLTGIKRQQHVESFAGSEDDNVEQWLKKFVAVAKLNHWWGDTELMPVQFLLHLKGK